MDSIMIIQYSINSTKLPCDGSESIITIESNTHQGNKVMGLMTGFLPRLSVHLSDEVAHSILALQLAQDVRRLLLLRTCIKCMY